MNLILVSLFEYLMVVPGAGIIWLYYQFTGKKKAYAQCIKHNYYLSAALGFCIVAFMFIAIRRLLGEGDVS